MRWDPELYLRFADERSRPFGELVQRIAADAPRRVVDLGCGTGALTAELGQRWPDAQIEGFDSSPEMIAACAAHASARVRFRLGDVAHWQPTPDVDVVVSNATLQWVPGHRELLRRWASALPPGGWLAMQVPGNFDAPSHATMRHLAEAPRWRALVGDVLAFHLTVGAATDYAALLLDAGLVVDAWETTYVHVLQGPDPVLEWVRGTGLRAVLSVLSPDDAADFQREYASLVRTAYPAGPHGTLFPFRRVFAVAHRPAR
jgi:trans-aconitate 2-methyltransferase